MSCDCDPDDGECNYALIAATRFLQGKRMWIHEQHADPLAVPLHRPGPPGEDPFEAIRSKAAETAPDGVALRWAAARHCVGAFLVAPGAAGLELGEYTGHKYTVDADARAAWDPYMVPVLDDDGENPLFYLSARQYNVEPVSWIRFVRFIDHEALEVPNAAFVQRGLRLYLRLVANLPEAEPDAPVELVARLPLRRAQRPKNVRSTTQNPVSLSTGSSEDENICRASV